MNHRATTLAWLAALSLVPFAAADYTFVETYEQPPYFGGWTYGTGYGYIQSTGGNPGAFHHDSYLFSFTPHPTTVSESIFTGDYRAAQVVSIGIDLITFMVDFTADARPVSVRLSSENSTPHYYLDDWGVYFVGPDNMPLAGEGWLSFDIEIPSQTVEPPDGWIYYRNGPDSPLELDWDALITGVDRASFVCGNPGMVHILQWWDVGFDNTRVTLAVSPCPADVDGDYAVDVLDLLAVLSAWGTVGGPEDVNGDGMVDVMDLLAVLNAWGPCF